MLPSIPMIASLLPLLRCPSSRQRLAVGTPAELEQLNSAIVAGGVRNSGGRVVTEPAEALLIVADRSCAYLVRDGIPILLPEEAVPAPGV